ncbi:MAG: hypothetical protein ABJQ21_24195 [Roseibium sp.]
MRRPAPKTHDDVNHPGPKAKDRLPRVHCRADPVTIQLAESTTLLKTLGDWADRSGFTSAVLDVSGITLGSFDYVMPDRAIDDRHAAWYSDTKYSEGALLTEAVAILGWRDGNWFAHIHAYWNEDGSNHLGHLLPDSLTIGINAQISGYGIKGARFEADLDPETEFTLFRVKGDGPEKPFDQTNALITTLAPFEDLHESVEELARRLPAGTIDIMGLGSLAGAEFRSGPPMTGLISEILVQPNAKHSKQQSFELPVRCVDLDGNLFSGTVQPGKCPALVTCELLLVAEPA